MATGTRVLQIAGGALGDGGTGDEFPSAYIHTSEDSNVPHYRAFVAAFDDTDDEYISFGFRVPVNYASGGVLKGLFWMDSAVEDDVVWWAALQCVSPGDSINMEELDPVNDGGGWAEDVVAVPATPGDPIALEIDMSGVLDSMAAGDDVSLIFCRGAGDSQDTATGDAVLKSELSFEYTTT